MFQYVVFSQVWSCLKQNVLQRIKQLQKSSKNESLVLRLAVEGGGCSGFQYVFKMEDRAKAALATEQEDDADAEEDK